MTEPDSQDFGHNPYSPLPPGSDTALLQYMNRQLDRTFQTLGEIDKTIDLYRVVLESYQPLLNQRLGLIWRRRPDAFGNAIQPVIIRWLLRRFDGGYRWFSTVMPMRNITRRVRRKAPWSEGTAECQNAVERLQALMERRSAILDHWAKLSRYLGHQEKVADDLRKERERLRQIIPNGPWFQQSRVFTYKVERLTGGRAFTSIPVLVPKKNPKAKGDGVGG